MALFDFLKRKKETERAKPAKKTEKVLVKKTSEKKIEKKEIADLKPQILKSKRTADFSYEIVKEPHISEKATNLADNNQYVFKVVANSNKTEIKKSVEGIYGVNVLSVNTIKIPVKKRRIGKTQGFKKGHIKAIVKIAGGQKIEIL